MAIIEDQAFEVENGLTVTQEDASTIGPLYTGGPSSPVGLDLSQGTFYVQNTGDRVIVWQKFGIGINDWIIYPASDVSFDPTGLQNLDPADVDVQAAIARLGNQSQADVTQLEAFNEDPTTSTTSNGWVTKQSITTVETKTAGIFKISNSAQIGQSDKEKVVGYRVQWRPGTSGTWQTLADVRNGLSVDDGFEYRTGFNLITLPTDNVISIRQQFGQTDEGGTGRSRFNTLVVERVGDL